MTENNKIIPETIKNKPLTDEELEDVSGGQMEQLKVHLMAFKRCAANPDHVYPEIRDACPICGCKEFTRA